jgi:hypothetical protein
MSHNDKFGSLVPRRVVKGTRSGGDLSSDGGLLPLRQIDQHLNLSRAAATGVLGTFRLC